MLQTCQAIRYLANSEKISKIADLKCSGLAVAYCKVSLQLFTTFFLLKLMKESMKRAEKHSSLF
jgi:hypothetical protein